jgi:hypothetical protein
MSVPAAPASTDRPRRRRGWAALARRSARRRPGGDATGRNVAKATAALFTLIIFLTFAVLAIGLGATEMDQSIRAADGQGIPGVVVPTAENCGGTGACSWTGNFTSSSGRLRLRSIDVAGGAKEVGRPFGGLYEGSAFIENRVYPYGSREWIWDIWILVGGAMTLSAPPGLTIIWWQNRHRRAIPKGPPELAGCCRRPDSQSGRC